MWQRRLCLGVSEAFDCGIKEQIALFSKIGFDGFFVEWKRGMDLHELREAADASGMLFSSVHAPFYRMADMWESDGRADEAVDELLECLEACAECNVPIMVCHVFIGFDRHEPNEVGIANFRRVVRRAGELGIKLAFENTEGEEYLFAIMGAFKDQSHVGFCWDTGHELCYNHGKDMLSFFGDRLFYTHINDNLGIKDYDGKITWLDDLHLLPFDGITDWAYVAERLARHGFAGELTLELCKKSKPDRHENDAYTRMDITEYLSEAYKRACRVAALLKTKNMEDQ